MSEKEALDYYQARVFAFGNALDAKSPHTDVILNDLAEFCRAGRSTFHADPRIHALLEGRREVFLRIKDFLTLNAEQLVEKYTKPKTLGE